MIILRADHQIDVPRAADDFLAFRLRDATGDCDHHAAAVPRRRLLHLADAADLGIDLLRRFLADVAGIQDDEVGVLGTCGLGEPGGRQRVRHTMGIVDVHLAAEGFDVDFAGSAHAGSVRTRVQSSLSWRDLSRQTIYLISQRILRPAGSRREK